MYNCRVCSGNQFTEEQMIKEKYLNYNKRGICKPCMNEYERNRQLLRKANQNPKGYLSCNSCDRVFASRNTGNYKGNNQHEKKNNTQFKLRVNCPFCKSDNIERF
jgi:hypothetical protein